MDVVGPAAGLPPRVVAVHASPVHRFSKQPVLQLVLAEGLGAVGDAHAGLTVKHRSRLARTPQLPNLRQVHLLQAELFGELAQAGFVVRPGELGENLTTSGLDLLALPEGTRLRVGDEAEVQLTGLRNPCVQIDRFQPGLLAAVLGRDAAGRWVRKAGVMAIVTRSGTVHAGDTLSVILPPLPHRALEPV